VRGFTLTTLNRFAVLLPLFAAAHGLARAQGPADSVSVTAFYAEWSGSARPSPEAYASFYAADGVVLPPNASPAVGRAAIAEWMRQAQSGTPYTTRPESITVDQMRFLPPRWALHRSTLRGQRIPKAGGEPTPFETKYVDLLHRTEAGRWEVVYRMWSDNR